MFSFYSHLSDIPNQAMKEIWDCSPREFQKETIPRLLMMRCSPHRLEALLLVQGTGGGESAVAQTVGCVECGVPYLPILYPILNPSIIKFNVWTGMS